MSVIDTVFRACDIRGLYGEEIDEDLAWKIGHAAAQFLRSLLSGYERGQASSNRLVVGHDMRPHSPALVEALISGITASGAGCTLLGMVDTPMLYFAINHLATCGGIQVTASHNPVEDNGFKIAGVKARPVAQSTGLKEIQHIVRTLRRMPPGASMAPVQKVDLWDAYREHVRRFLDLRRPLTVVADAANGMAGKMLPAVFDDTDLRIVPLNFETGAAPAHRLDPTLEESRRPTAEAVVARSADFGVCLDGGAERCVFVDEQGQAVRGDLLTALLAAHFLRDAPGGTIVYDLRSSRVLPDEIRAAGGVPRRERVGRGFMQKAMADGHGLFAGEINGHFYFRDNFNCDSGAIALAVTASMLSARDRPLSELVTPLKRYWHTGEISFPADDGRAKMKAVEAAFADAEIDYLDGVTCQYEDWWFNVRPSNTEPRLRLSLEARDEETMNEKLDELKGILGAPATP